MESCAAGDPYGLLGGAVDVAPLLGAAAVLDRAGDAFAASLALPDAAPKAVEPRAPARARGSGASRSGGARKSATPRAPRQKMGNLKIGRLKPGWEAESKTEQPAAGPGDAPDAGLLESNACSHCNGRMHQVETEYRCAGCGLIAEGDTSGEAPTEAGRPPPPGRLRMVGPNSGFFQPDLDRSSNANSEASQREQIFKEYLMYRDKYIENGGRAFPVNLLSKAADLYHQIQVKLTKRSDGKKRIMAAFLQIAGASPEIGFVPDKNECAEMMQLKTHGIAQGNNFIRMMKASGHISVDVNQDTCMPHIKTAFSHLQLDETKYGFLRDAAEQVVRTAVEANIGTSSVIRSKAMAAAFVVLRRYALSMVAAPPAAPPAPFPAAAKPSNASAPKAAIVPKPAATKSAAPKPAALKAAAPKAGAAEAKKPALSAARGAGATERAAKPWATQPVAAAAGRIDLSLADFCDLCGIRKSTIDRFIAELTAYHSCFVEVYKGAGLYAGEGLSPQIKH
jgi:hypothetical protein